VADQTFGCGKEVPHADTEADTRYNFVAIFFVDDIFDGLCAGLCKVLRFDLYQVLYCGLYCSQRV
jgi:hypothetical protein